MARGRAEERAVVVMRREQAEAVGAGLGLLAVVAFLALGVALTAHDILGWLT